jgi:RimJ/RimL family protein N-acetyltransferase
MNFYPLLENRKVILRPLEEADIPLLLPVALSQPDVWKFLSTPIHTEETLTEFVRQAIEWRAEEKAIPFLIIDKHTNTVAGSTRFANLEQRHKRVEIGWTWISEAFHRTGLNKAMKYLMLEHAFELMDLNRVEIKTSELNERSRRAIESIGAKYEATLRHHMVNNDGTLRNTVYYSIIKEEWPETRQRIFRRYFPEWY